MRFQEQKKTDVLSNDIFSKVNGFLYVYTYSFPKLSILYTESSEKLCPQDWCLNNQVRYLSRYTGMDYVYQISMLQSKKRHVTLEAVGK